jgi:uncharacterized membrane protein
VSAPTPAADLEPSVPAAGATPAPASPAGQGPPPAPRRDWERWLGVRGAALLGGIVLALAGLLFFQYSIQKGWISPTVRVVLGTLAGVGLLVGSEALRRRDYVAVANALAGGSVVVLYAAFWAAGVHFGLVPMTVAWGLMALVTVVAGLLAVKRDALVVAVLGLVGGFATPLLLGQGEDRPLGLFGYLLLLDLGLFAVARRRRWPSLGLLALLGTLGLEGLWAVRHFEPERIFLAVGVLAAFAVVFLWTGLPAAEGSRRAAFATRAGAVLLPFGFAAYFATKVDLAERLVPIAGLLVLLAGAASWVARREGAPWLRTGAAMGSVAVLGVWLAQGPPETIASAWAFAGAALALAVVFHLGLEIAPVPDDDPLTGATVAFGGLAVLTLLAAGWDVSIWPWVVAWLALGGAWVRQAARGHRPAWLMAAAGLLLAGGLGSLHLRHARDSFFPEPWLFLGLAVAVAAAGLALALGGSSDRRRVAGHGTALYGVVSLALLGISPLWRVDEAERAGLGGLALVVVAVLAAAALAEDGRWAFASAFAAAAVPYGWIDHDLVPATLIGGFLIVVLQLVAPLVSPRLGSDRWAWRGAAIAGPVMILALIEAWRRQWGSEAIGALPLLVGAATLAALAGARRRAPDDGTRRVAVVWMAAVALGFVSLAIPLQLDRQWITIGWALEALAVILLWRRLDHPGLKYLGAALAVAVGARLLLNPYVLRYGDAGGWPVLNWLLYTYLIPAFAIGAMAAVLRPIEAERLRGWERSFLPGERGAMAAVLGLLAVVIGFAWINLTVLDAFAAGPRLEISLDRRPARDLTLSLAWAVYALGLLVAGVWKARTALRWVSLAFLLLAIAKVFLYDLGELEDLYRVLSLVGLAVSLILVSLLYQRFVFRDRAGEEA